jgi:hypothetical protein
MSDAKIWRVLTEYENGMSLPSLSDFVTRAEAEVLLQEGRSWSRQWAWIMDIDGRLEQYGGTRYESADPRPETNGASK